MRHPTSREQLTFERRDYRANPIEGPEESNPDFLIAVIAVVGLLTAAIIAVLERL